MSERLAMAIALVLVVLTISVAAQAGSPFLDETLSWMDNTLNHMRIRLVTADGKPSASANRSSVGPRTFTYDGCKLTFSLYGGVLVQNYQDQFIHGQSGRY